MIYFFQNTKNKLVKIGTSTDVVTRHRQIQYFIGSPVNVLGVMEGNESTEKELHDRFSALRVEGEWFKNHNSIKSFIDTNCAPYIAEQHNGPNGYQPRQGDYIPGPGRDSFEKVHGSKAQSFRFLMTIEHHQHILTRAAALNISAAEYLRRLIEQDMEQPPGRPSKP